MPLSQDELRELAHALMEAEHNVAPIPPLTERRPDLTSGDAYTSNPAKRRGRRGRPGADGS